MAAPQPPPNHQGTAPPLLRRRLVGRQRETGWLEGQNRAPGRLHTHISAEMRTLLHAHRDWLTVTQMPAYAPDLNPVEGAWPAMKNSLGNLGSCGTPHRLAGWPRS
jgi:hypothetical protein